MASDDARAIEAILMVADEPVEVSTGAQPARYERDSAGPQRS